MNVEPRFKQGETFRFQNSESDAPRFHVLVRLSIELLRTDHPPDSEPWVVQDVEGGRFYICWLCRDRSGNIVVWDPVYAAVKKMETQE